MKKNRWLAGWTRIGETEFKTLAGEAVKSNPFLINSLRQAIVSCAAADNVPAQIRDRYLRWLSELQRN